MSDDRETKNTALPTLLAFHYQILIGLNECFSLEKSQSVWFEKDGDVSVVGANENQSRQIEVKDYSTPLTDNHENLWKTLSNWMAPEFNYSQYGKLILSTTQAFGKRTALKDWNLKNADERLQILKSIYEVQKEKDKESVITKLQDNLFKPDKETVLKDILGKVILNVEVDDTEGLKKKVKDKLNGYIPTGNQDFFIQNLIGFIYDQGNKQNWCITKKAFDAKREELTSLLCRKEFTFPSFRGEDASQEKIIQCEDKLFVKKIHEIEYDEMLADAVGNWIELTNSLELELDEYPLYREKTKAYQKDLIKKFKTKYSTAKLSHGELLRKSKILYNEVIGENPLPIDNFTPHMAYKNGLIHDAMDDSELNIKWKVENE